MVDNQVTDKKVLLHSTKIQHVSIPFNPNNDNMLTINPFFHHIIQMQRLLKCNAATARTAQQRVQYDK
jgi:hypothetical protein